MLSQLPVIRYRRLGVNSAIGVSTLSLASLKLMSGVPPTGLHEFMDAMQIVLGELHDALAKTYFRAEEPSRASAAA